MLDTTQILIVAAITVMTVILTIIGVQLIFVLKDVRQMLTRINAIVSEVEKIGLNIGSSYSELTGFVAGIKNIFLVTDFLANRKGKKHDKK
jgi:hypothetical protein